MISSILRVRMHEKSMADSLSGNSYDYRGEIRMKKATWFTSILLSAALCISSFTGVLMTPAAVYAEEEYEEYDEDDSDDDSSEEGDSEEDSYYFEQDPTVDTNSIKGWPQGASIDADSAVVMDAKTGAILYAKHMDEPKYPASITKIMTVLLALENGNLEDKVKFSEYAVYSIEFGSAHLGLTEGEELTLEQCLYGIMLASANEISNAVAEYVAGDVETFAKMMNKKAKALGCTNTHFVNPNGLHDPDHYVSARDMALIMREALKYDKFREIINTDEYHYPPTNLVKEDRYFVNHHQMLMDESYEGIIGGKTGFTDEAFNTLVTAAERKGMTLISVVLHAPGIESEYGDTRTILDYGFDNFKEYKVKPEDLAGLKLEIKGIEDPEELKKIKEADLTQEPFAVKKTVVTLPKGTEISELTCEMDFEKNRMNFYFSDQKVGSSKFAYTGVWEEETELLTEDGVETELTSEATTEAAEVLAGAPKTETGEAQEGFMGKVNELVTQAKQGVDVAKKLMEGNEYIAPILGGILLLIFVPLLILMISRHIRYKRMIKQRVQEMIVRKKMEEEIERKSTAQIEAELRERDMVFQLEMEQKKSQKTGDNEGEQ